ncbi:carbohydrate-binding protein [Marinobacter sp.]|uniref:carbohydrate-binding protein n=1 Tax=Marinobacter sp. TaxID=50741 RepID=UPI001A0C8CB8|nr:carbohydrate-binding protein [Marinobacter sp.]MBE0487289.1 carbohydrate-binding protein [Marinobacter sp.]
MNKPRSGPVSVFYIFMLVVMALGMPALASAEDCVAEDHKWSETLYYPAGAVVYHNDSWFESREVHQAKEPGISFDWKRLHATPDCSSDNEQRPQPFDAADAEQGMTRMGDSAEVCERPEQWLFAETYAAGDLVSHGGNVWKATEETNGDMPGVKQPPRWELVEDHCSIQQAQQPAL